MQSVPKIVRDRLQAAQPVDLHPDADLLTAFAEQSLPASERARMLDHLALCTDCRDIVALALPPTETVETTARPARTGWLTWPVLRWGFVAAGVVIVASVGVLQHQRRATSDVAVYGPSSQVAQEEARPQLTAAPPAIPAAKQVANTAASDRIDSNRVDEVRKPNGVAGERKTSVPAAPPSSRRTPLFHGSTSGAPGGVVGGPKPPSQFQNNYNVQQQVSNASPAPALKPLADQLSSAKSSPAEGETAGGVGAAPATNTEGVHLEAQLRDDSSDSQLFADKSSVSKTKLPVTVPARGQIAGRVVDVSGAVVPNARITVTPATTGKSATVVTDSQGAFLIAGLPTGNYKAQAQAPGFNTTTQDLTYDASRPSTYNFTLNVGSVAETVEVSSAQTVLPTDGSSTVGGPINSKGRNYGTLTSSSPGLLPRWTVNGSGALQRSFDQGKTWQTVDVNASLTSSASFDIATESRAKELARENDANKKLLKQEPASPVFRAVTVAGPEVWAGGSAGILYHSLDAGNHWTRVVPASAGIVLTGDIISLEFLDSRSGKVTTSNPEVWTTNDAGQTWQKQ